MFTIHRWHVQGVNIIWRNSRETIMAKKSQSREEKKYDMSVPCRFWFCFWHTLWCWRLRISVEWLSTFLSQSALLAISPFAFAMSLWSHCRRLSMECMMVSQILTSRLFEGRFPMKCHGDTLSLMLPQAFGNLVPFLKKPRFRSFCCEEPCWTCGGMNYYYWHMESLWFHFGPLCWHKELCNAMMLNALNSGPAEKVMVLEAAQPTCRCSLEEGPHIGRRLNLMSKRWRRGFQVGISHP